MMRLVPITIYKLKMMFRDKVFTAAMIIIPLFIALAAGYALKQEKMNIVPIAIADEDNSNTTRVLIERLSGKKGLEVLQTDRDKAMDLVKSNRVEVVYILKKGFEEKIKSGENEQIIDVAKSPESFAADFTNEVMAGEIIRFTANATAVKWVLDVYGKTGKAVPEGFDREIERHADSQWEPRPLMTIDYRELEGESSVKAEKILAPRSAVSTGIILVFMMFQILFSSGWLIEERSSGMIKRLVAGPEALALSFAGNISALFITGMIQVTAFLLLDRLVFGIDLLPGFWPYTVIALYLTAVISISLFLSAVLKTPAQLQAGAPVFALMTGFAGGCFWNTAEVPVRVKQLARFTPQGWAMEGLNRLMLFPSDMAGVVLPMMVLFIITLILLPLSYIIIRANSTV